MQPLRMPLARPAAWVPFILGAASVASLLLYFYGVASMPAGTIWLLLPAFPILAIFLVWAHRRDAELRERVVAGLWAGSLATLFYDLVRVPISASGVPVFKAISYFGTLLLGQTSPTFASELAGWSYHLCNGIGFGLMYAVLVARPRLWSAVAWGVSLEVAMLVTPYAEVFGYRLSPGFLAITLGAHVVYGAALWGSLRVWERLRNAPRHLGKLVSLALLPPLGIGAVASDFYSRHAATIPPGPPPYVGSHLYTTWNVFEPDRLAALWVLHRFVDPAARFYFIEPFSHVSVGHPVDMPEAEIRRSGTRSATEVLLASRGLQGDEKLARLGEMTHVYEITRWQLPARPREFALGEGLKAAVGPCPGKEVLPCVERSFRFLDEWYGADRLPSARR
jgi:hypothetical protein